MCDYETKYQKLLRDLKTTVEGLLASQVANVWHIYGGLNRLHFSLDKIFHHGSIGSNYFNFIQGLEWLQPESSKSYFSLDCEFNSNLPSHIKDDKASIWLYKSLEKHSLSQKLSWLLSDKSHLLNCYRDYAFLCQDQYAEATLICIKSVERNQASLMSEINPCLFLIQTNIKVFNKIHRRCSSFPDTFMRSNRKSNISIKSYLKTCSDTNIRWGKLKSWHSMPNLLNHNNNNNNNKITKIMCKTTPTTPVHIKKNSKNPDVSKKKLHLKPLIKSNTVTDSLDKKEINHHVIINNCDIIEHTPPLSSSNESGNFVGDLPKKSDVKCSTSPRLVNSFLPLKGEKDYYKNPKKTFIEDGGMSVLPMATGFFPKPRKGQSLLSFLTSSQFSRTNAELDRENAHFSISEAIISAMEQIKCKRDLKLDDDQYNDSDPEILDIKQRIRLRKRVDVLEKQRKFWVDSQLSNSRTDTATNTSNSPSTISSLSDTTSDIDDIEIDENFTLSDRQGLSISMASLYSEADLLKRPRGAPDGASDIFSAEGVALSLISKFSEKQLPKASELEWLVSEEDAPQSLLPLPNSWPVSPDDSEITSLRGTQDWAPPRPQIIFTLHPPPSRKDLMIKQNYRCAGCSMKVAPQYASRFRYCDYLGRYFCTGCHTNQLALIPGRVLQKWDFTHYPVSSFSYRLLEQMYTDPLFRVIELNRHIEKSSKNLKSCRNYRLALFYIKDFIYVCKLAEDLQKLLNDEKFYILNEPEIYSMEDLINVRNGEMRKKLKNLIDICCKHTTDCPLCLARGFICGICNSNKIIFPWQLYSVKRCNICGACYHIKCWNTENEQCKKCLRISKRKMDCCTIIAS